MCNFEKKILYFVGDNPGCDCTTLIEAIGHPDVKDEVEYMVQNKKLDRWYSGGNPHHYIPHTYTPMHLRG